MVVLLVLEREPQFSQWQHNRMDASQLVWEMGYLIGSAQYSNSLGVGHMLGVLFSLSLLCPLIVE